MPLTQATIRENREIARGYYQLAFDWPAVFPTPQPGQFATVRVVDGAVPLLRRPFAFSAFDGDQAELIYWRRGMGTELLAAKQPGDLLDIMAPLGTGWPTPASGTTPLLVAGGVGMGPIFFLATALWSRKVPARLLLGARTADLLPTLKLFDDGPTRLATDDGSAHEHGSVVDLLNQELQAAETPREIFACGPTPMLRAVHTLAEEHGVPAWVSMEQHMGCGVGACLGCAIRVTTGNGYARVCTEGPVFRSTEIVW